MSSKNTRALTKESFDEQVLKSDKPVLVDFGADWCQPCRMIAPTIDRVAESFAGRAVVGTVDVDVETELASRYGITSIPTVILFKDGEVSKTFTGIRSEDDFSSAIEDVIATAA